MVPASWMLENSAARGKPVSDDSPKPEGRPASVVVVIALGSFVSGAPVPAPSEELQAPADGMFGVEVMFAGSPDSSGHDGRTDTRRRKR